MCTTFYFVLCDSSLNYSYYSLSIHISPKILWWSLIHINIVFQARVIWKLSHEHPIVTNELIHFWKEIEGRTTVLCPFCNRRAQRFHPHQSGQCHLGNKRQPLTRYWTCYLLDFGFIILIIKIKNKVLELLNHLLIILILCWRNISRQSSALQINSDLKLLCISQTCVKNHVPYLGLQSINHFDK